MEDAEKRSAANKRPVIVLAGPPCRAKSTTAAWLAPVIGGIHLQVDSILAAIVPGSDFSLDQRLLAYAVAARAMRPILDRDLSPLLDCTYSRRAVRREVVDCLKGDDGLVVIEFAVSVAVAVQRFRARGRHGAVNLTSALVVDRVQSYPYGYATAIVGSEQSPEDIRTAVLRILGQDVQLDREKWVAAGR
jgi:predicted kinase